MSDPVPTAGAGLPVVNQALEPAWVRQGSKATQQAYQTALGFEGVLVQQLAASLTASSGLGEGASEEGGESTGAMGSGGGDAGSGALASMLPQALSAGVMSAGGLGLAAQMTRQLEGSHVGGPVSPSGGSAA
jgi:Rod binding domain-containing protein